MSVVNIPPVAPGRLGFARKADVDLFVERLEAFESGRLSPDEWKSFRLLNGVYGQRQDGVMMIRAKLPGGFITPAQLEAMADVAEKYGGGKGHVTTRQNVQYHFVPMADVEAALARLAESGITTKEACGHSVRNWTCCPFAGVAKDEAFDPTPYVEALARHLLRGPYSSTLPRKLKPSLGGCCGTDCSQAFINDLGFLARKRTGADGAVEHGFQLLAGGHEFLDGERAAAQRRQPAASDHLEPVLAVAFARKEAEVVDERLRAIVAAAAADRRLELAR